nr:ATP-binding cassette domain-containing protein [Jannaschia sp. Os4]
MDAEVVAPGGVTALFGPSGAGKTTFVRAVAGLARPESGRIALDGRVLWDQGTDVPPHRRGIGTVFQDARLLPHRDVRANLLYGAPGDGRLGEVVDLLELGPLLDRRPRHLSGGEAARVALGRALLTEPRLVVLDEPLASLDARLRGAILPYLARLKATGVPMLLITHDAEEVVALADRVAFLDGGRVVDAGPLAEVLGDPVRAARLGAGQAGVVLTEADGLGVVGRVRARDVVLVSERVEVAGGVVVPVRVERVRDGVAVCDTGGVRLLADVGDAPIEGMRFAVLRGGP